MYDWRKILITSQDPITKAISLLDQEGLQIVLVVDEQLRLVGTITDGDVRRGLIRGLTLESSVSEIMRSDPRSAAKKDGRKEILIKMKALGLLQMPVLDESKVVVGLETLNNLNRTKRYDTPVFLMAGGFGKRLHPLTLSTPKPLLKIGDKPILQSILENFIVGGFHQFYISTHYKAEQLREYFGSGSDWNVDIEYIHEDVPLGTAGALGLLPDHLPKIPLIMMNGDLLTELNFGQLLRYHEESGGVGTLCVREYDIQVPYGVITASENSVKEIIEKPVHKVFVNAGIYVLNPEFYSKVEIGQYVDMPELIQSQISEGARINMYPLHEYWLDIGRMEDFERERVR
jgi:dTDP-glucose pyrophosphorylase